MSCLYLLLQCTWNHFKNLDVGQTVITPGTSIGAYWMFEDGAAGHPQAWSAQACPLGQDSNGCTYCKGNAVCPHTSIAVSESVSAVVGRVGQ